MPLPPPPAIEPGVFNGTTLYDPEGREVAPADGRSLSPREVRAAVLGGARLVWDPCGCGGYCNNLAWPDEVALRRQARLSPPRFRKNHPVDVVVLTGAGGTVLLASGGVQWGDVIR
jgi:hypothetical protein